MAAALSVAGCSSEFNNSTRSGFAVLKILEAEEQFNFGTKATGSQSQTTFTLANAGRKPAILGEVSAATLGLSGDYALAAETNCETGKTLSPAGTCALVIEYAPSVPGPAIATVAIPYNNGKEAVKTEIEVQALAAPPALLTVSDGPTYGFGTLATGSSASHIFTVTNSGGVPAVLGNISAGDLGLAAPYSFTGGTCVSGASVADSGGFCTLIVEFAPSGNGAYPESIDLNYHDGAADQIATRALSGTGAPPAALSISNGPTYNYGTRAIGSTTSFTFTITNSGGVPAILGTISDAALGLSAPFSANGGTCTTGGLVAPAGNCTLIVDYAPTATEVSSGTIDLSYNDGATNQSTSRAVTGTGAVAAALAISDGPTYDYGTRATGSALAKTFTVGNTGGVNATLGTVSLAALNLAAPYSLGAATNCSTGASIAPAANCQIEIVFSPGSTGTFNDQIDLGYNDTITNQTASRAITGIGVAPASLTISDGVTYTFTSKTAGSPAIAHTFTVTNSGGVPAILGTVSGAGLGLAVPYSLGAATTCITGGSVAAGGGSCNIEVTFAPSAAGTFNDQIDLGYNNGASNQTSSRPISGTGLSPASLAISDGPTYNFGTWPTGATSTGKVFTITNSGQTAATLGTVSLAGLSLAAPYALGAATTCVTGGTVAASGGSCFIELTFSPSATGAFNDQIDLAFNDGVNNQTASRAITGVGASPASLAISDGPTFDFSNVITNTSVSYTFTITNSGGVAGTLGTVSAAALGIAAPYSLGGATTCATGGSVGASGGACLIQVVFAPTAAGTFNDQIDLGYSNGVSAQTTSRPITGAGITPAALAISDGATYDFGTRATGSTTPHTFTVTNSGQATAILGTITAAGLGLVAPYSLGAATTCATGASLAGSGGTCDIEVVFAPAANGTFNDQIDLGYNDGAAAQTASRAVTGVGVTPASLAISDGPGAFDYGLKANGSSVAKTFTLTNSGGISATLGTISTAGVGLASPYSVTGGTCTTGGSVAASGSCTIVVTFAPSSSGSYSDSIDVGYNNGATGQTASRGVTGTSLPPASVAILADSPIHDFGQQFCSASTEFTERFTVRAASGTVDATSVGEGTPALAAPFSFADGTFPGTGGTCTGTLVSGASCTIVVKFKPSTAALCAASHSDSVRVAYNDGIAAQTATLMVNGEGTRKLRARALSQGAHHTCAILADNSVKCWGHNLYGKLGLGDTASRGTQRGEMGNWLARVDLGAGRTARAISAGNSHNCALLDNNTVKCWGYDAYGQLGLGDTANRGDGPAEMGDNLAAIDLGTGRSAKAISSGGFHSCALLDNNTVKCWGQNAYGQLGLGDTANRGDGPAEMGDNLTAIDLGTGRTAKVISSGGYHSCALLDNSTVKCWGRNTEGQLGLGDAANRGDGPSEMGDNLAAIDLGTGRTARAISSGSLHSCALLDNNTVKCWGNNGQGELGLGDTANRGDGPAETGDNLAAINLGTGRTAVAISAGEFHNCALLDNNTVKCWGDNTSGQLGLGDTARRGDGPAEMGDSLAAVDLGVGRTAKVISSGNSHNCALLDNNTVKCWGLNGSGQLGAGDAINRGDGPDEMGHMLDTVPLITIQASAGNSTCALVEDGSLKCWGFNGNGELGIGDTASRGTSAVQMGTALPAVNLGTGAVIAEVSHSMGNGIGCALLTSGQVKCWGDNFAGGLGLGDGLNRGASIADMGDALPFVNLGTGRTAKAVSAGGSHTCAILDDNTVKCWGNNTQAQCGHDNTLVLGDEAGEMGDALPVTLLGTGRTAKQISSGPYHTCAVLDNNTVKCWGQNIYGELGQGHSLPNRGDGPGEMGDGLAVTDLGTGRTAKQVGSGRYFSCALLDNNAVKCWGLNDSGQLGLGDTVNRGGAAGQMGDALPAVDLGTGKTAKRIAVGGDYACALLNDNTVKCWGDNAYGQLGLGDIAPRGDSAGEMGDALPTVSLGTGRTVKDISAGLVSACALLDDNTLKCWGLASSGQLGNGSSLTRGDAAGEMGDSLPGVLW